MKLHIGRNARGTDFSLPLDLVTQTIAILAKKGAGKSYTASVMVENLLDAGQVPVIIDPTGAWWGLKSSADGKSAAYPLVVFGGEHGDLPLEENAGEATARAIVEQRFPAIIDLSLFRKGQVKRFITPFLETVYRLNRQPLMLVVDEADDICPQKPFGDEAQMVGALEDVVKRGRKKGIGCTLITQRPADLAKQVLTQCEMLVAMRLTHPLDIKAVMEWVNVHADPKPAAAMVESLPSLPVGTAWFWSPGWGDIFERIQVSRRRTFDSGATPKAGEQVITPKRMAQPDLTKIGSDIMQSVQRAKDNDPVALRAKIAKLERQVNEKVSAPIMTVPEKVEVLVFDDADRNALHDIAQTLGFVSKQFADMGQKVTQRMDRVAADERNRPKVKHEPIRIPLPHRPPGSVGSKVSENRRLPGIGEDLPEGEKRILIAVAQYQVGSTREALTVLTGYKKSSRDTYLQRLRSRGFILSNGDRIVVTEPGIDALGKDYEPLPTGIELRDYWFSRLPTGESRILKLLVNYPRQFVDREKITSETGYLKSSRDTYIQRLSSRELVDTTREGVKASDNLFD